MVTCTEICNHQTQGWLTPGLMLLVVFWALLNLEVGGRFQAQFEVWQLLCYKIDKLGTRSLSYKLIILVRCVHSPFSLLLPIALSHFFCPKFPLIPPHPLSFISCKNFPEHGRSHLTVLKKNVKKTDLTVPASNN